MLLLCIGGSPPSCLLPSAYKGLFMVCLKILEVSLHTLFVQLLWRTAFAFIWCRNPTHGYCGWYNDSCRDMSGLLEQIIIIVFSLHLGEPLVLDLAMLSFISLSYTVTTFNSSAWLILLSSYQAGNLLILNIMTSCSGFSFFLGNLHVLLHIFP